MTEVEAKSIAVSYVRVSTSAQADKDIDPEGYSLPAQREACERKANELGAVIVAEYKDRGESAKTADRPGLKALLSHVTRERNVDYVIVHKVDRLARNREDDVAIGLTLRQAGAKLVSASENIDETPSGKLVHGILATIAEFYSGNLALEAKKGMSQKAKMGGTPFKAPIGYLNTIERIDGRDVRTVIIDEERAPHIQWAFDAYTSGNWSIQRLARDLERRGLRNQPRGGADGKAIGTSRVRSMLSNRYYVGKVVWNGVEHEGRHPALISESTYEQVQAVLKAHDRAAERSRKHSHYLKGSLFCARCGGRMSFMKARGKLGTLYDYFYCLRRKREGACTQPHLPVDDVEAAVAAHYKTVELPVPDRSQVLEELHKEIDREQQRRGRDLRRAERQIRKLHDERVALLKAHYAGAVPTDLLKTEQHRIRRELDAAEQILANAAASFDDVEDALHTALDLVTLGAELYAMAPGPTRRLLNQFFFSKVFLDGAEIGGATFTPEMGALRTAFAPAELDVRSLLASSRQRAGQHAASAASSVAVEGSLVHQTIAIQTPESVSLVGSSGCSLARSLARFSRPPSRRPTAISRWFDRAIRTDRRGNETMALGARGRVR